MDERGRTRAERIVRISGALYECMARAAVVASRVPAGDLDWAARCAELALIRAREAGWWHLLHRCGGLDGLDPVFRRAVGIAEHATRADARFWRESAGDWLARAEGRPTSDAAGALSNWDELGVRA